MDEFKIQCTDEMMAKIEEIAFSETQIEVGGFLIGTYDKSGAVVTNVLPARHSVGRSTQLTFTHDTWNALYEELNESGGALVGWFHSHPNFGVFLSEHDQFIQQNFFGADGNITIVVDPIRGRRGWFYSQDGKIQKFEQEDTTRGRLGVSATNPDENIEAIMGANNSGVTTTKVVLISAVMSILGGFLGFGLSVATSGSSTAQSDVATLNLRVQQLEAQLGFEVQALPTKEPAPVNNETKKPTAKPSAKSTAAGKGTTGTGSKGAETSTATTLKTVNVVPNAICNPKIDKDPAKKYTCKVTKASAPTVGKWVAAKGATGTTGQTEPKVLGDTTTTTSSNG